MNRVSEMMHNLKPCLLAGIVMCAAIFGGTVAGYGQDLQVTPSSGWNYGPVAVGTSQRATFNLESLPPSPVWTYIIYLNESSSFSTGSLVTPHDGHYTLGAFSFDPMTYVPLPREMSVGEVIPVDIIFAPSTPGDYSAYFLLYCNDSINPPGPQAYYYLQGTGVGAPVPLPASLLLFGPGLAGLAAIRRRLKK